VFTLTDAVLEFVSLQTIIAFFLCFFCRILTLVAVCSEPRSTHSSGRPLQRTHFRELLELYLLLTSPICSSSISGVLTARFILYMRSQDTPDQLNATTTSRPTNQALSDLVFSGIGVYPRRSTSFDEDDYIHEDVRESNSGI
jgi:hypothetical protein